MAPRELDMKRLAQGIEDLGTEDFETFSYQLVEVEATERHPGVRLDPPALAAGAKDGGKDIIVTVRRAPKLGKDDYQAEHHVSPLTEDPIEGLPETRTVYSCKATRDWVKKALRDVKDKTRGRRAIEVLREGGYFKLLINVDGKLDTVRKGDELRPLESLRAAFSERMKSEHADAPDPSPRIEILDGPDLERFLRNRKPSQFLDRWASKLGLESDLRGLEAWRSEHRGERDLPDFEPDQVRKTMMADLVAWARTSRPDPKERIAWVGGPPGVGKTRLVLEALRESADVRESVLVALSWDESIAAIDRGLFERHTGPLLVVDDCPLIHVDAIAAKFRAAARTDPLAHLLVITPLSGAAEIETTTSRQWRVEPLADSEVRKIVDRELGADAADAHADIVRLVEGYPWFAVLLAREVLEEGRAPVNLSEAVDWCLASRKNHHASDQLESIRRTRLRALFATIITSGTDWDRLENPRREGLAKAVGLHSWVDLVDAARDCDRRGLLRRRQEWRYKYVTPAILEREVIHRMIRPGGDDPGGRRLQDESPSAVAELLERMRALSLDEKLFVGVAKATSEQLEHAGPGWDGFRASGATGAPLQNLAEHAPQAALRVLHARIRQSPLGELLARSDVRRDLVFALEAIAKHRECFSDVEASLFRLARAENESYGNNATGVWVELFHVELDTTGLALPARLERLAQRLTDPEPAARLLGLRALELILSHMPVRFRRTGGSDGLRAVLLPEAVSGRTRALELLADRFADPEGSVGAVARGHAIRSIRAAFGRGVGTELLQSMRTHLPLFSSAERVALREAVAMLRMYDTDNLVSTELDTVALLEHDLAPVTFADRLLDAVGSWGPAAERALDEERDRALAAEGLRVKPELVARLDWLFSPEAVRARGFVYVLGETDESLELYPHLEQRLLFPSGQDLVSRYLAGRAAKDRVQIEQLLGHLRADATKVSLLVHVIVAIGATDDWAAWLVARVRERCVSQTDLDTMARPAWCASVSDEPLSELVDTLLRAPLRALHVVVDLLADRLKASERPVPEELLPISERALNAYAADPQGGIADYRWEKVAGALLRRGRVRAVASAAVAALARRGLGEDHFWNALHLAVDADPEVAWEELSVVLDRADSSGGYLTMAFMFHRRSFRWPAEAALRWVGDDERRGRTVASIVRPYAAQLDPVLAQLIRRFGAHSSVADVIRARVHSTEGAVSSLAANDTERLAEVRSWSGSKDPAIEAFVLDLAESLERSREEHAAYEEHEKRRWGT